MRNLSGWSISGEVFTAGAASQSFELLADGTFAVDGANEDFDSNFAARA
jgi:hypothetical protein